MTIIVFRCALMFHIKCLSLMLRSCVNVFAALAIVLEES